MGLVVGTDVVDVEWVRSQHCEFVRRIMPLAEHERIPPLPNPSTPCCLTYPSPATQHANLKRSILYTFHKGRCRVTGLST